jgi:hypothetical protein
MKRVMRRVGVCVALCYVGIGNGRIENDGIDRRCRSGQEVCEWTGKGPA